MRTTLKVVSIISTVIGGLVILQYLGEGGEDASSAVIGGAMFAAQGIIALIYLKNEKK